MAVVMRIPMAIVGARRNDQASRGGEWAWTVEAEGAGGARLVVPAVPDAAMPRLPLRGGVSVTVEADDDGEGR